MPVEETLKYDFSINDLKWMKKFIVDDKLIHYRWLANHIVENEENVQWDNGAKIYKIP